MFQSVASECSTGKSKVISFNFQNAIALYRMVQLLFWRPLNYTRTYTIMNVSLRFPEFAHSLCYIQEYWFIKVFSMHDSLVCPLTSDFKEDNITTLTFFRNIQ